MVQITLSNSISIIWEKRRFETWLLLTVILSSVNTFSSLPTTIAPSFEKVPSRLRWRLPANAAPSRGILAIGRVTSVATGYLVDKRISCVLAVQRLPRSRDLREFLGWVWCIDSCRASRVGVGCRDVVC